ncbi:MAG: sugar ABC transporter substrate-binding protein [Gemmatimonadaceae bacterium]
MRAAHAAAIWALAASVACGEAKGSGVVTLRFWGMGREGEVVKEMIPEFERRNPGIRVSVQQMPWTAAHEKLLTAYVGDAMPDVAQIGNTWISEFEALSAIVRLDSLVERSPVIDPDAYFSGIWESNVIDGRAYGVPWYVDTRLIFYHKDLLAAAGYSRPPDNWREWREAMEKIKKQVGSDRYAIFLPTNEWAQPVILGMQAGAPLLRGEGAGSYGFFRDPRFKRAFEFYVDLYRSDLAPRVGNTQMANVYQEFARGYFAMYITGPWNLGEFARRLPPEMAGRWSTAPLPGPDGPGVSTAGGSSLVLFRASKHAAEAWKLIEYLSDREQQIRFYRLTGNLPARKDAWQDSSLTASEHLRAFRDQLERVQPTPEVPEWELIATRVLEHAESAIRGSATTDEAVAALDRDVDLILEKRRWLIARRAGKDVAAQPAGPSP